NPDVLEQRIGRLDCIGQEHTVYIHVPYIENSDEAFWLRWYHEGMDAFEHTCSIGPAVLHSLHAEYGKPLTVLAQEPEKADSLIDRTRALRRAKRALLEHGRDRLLELNSCRPRPAHALCEQIAAVDADVALRHFIEHTCDCYGVHFEAHSRDCWIVQPSDHMYIEHFPGLPDVACMLTTSRDIAVRREDVQFLSWDHPLVRGALDLILHSGEGKATFGALHLASLAAGLVLVEAVFRLACTADAKLNAQRYLPPTLIRVLIDAHGQDRAAEYDLETLSQALEPVPRHRARQLLEAHHGEIRQHIAVAAACADQQLPPWRERSVAHMRTELGAEWRRLAALARVNPSIRPDELQALQDEMTQLNEALLQSRVQMEALRVIFTY
ncbi:MAG: RNA polymerase-associated protein RapA, partial [Candidatus Tectomicrobia bacterium]